ncbi:MAG TPA: SpoIIE family protein phosphatase [Phycisphaerae bacterium]|nr:SpoIIE family protein phosphatase [Phycisphaerae bacterium]
MRILIAEDERITRATIARQLKAAGHEITEAEDGQQAWDLFRAAPAAAGFDIVITDWEMPRLSGVELVRKLRETPRNIYTYILMLTSRSDKSDVVQGIEAGADDFLTKPFDKEELRVRLLAGQRIVQLERALNQQNAELREANDHIRSGLRAAARVQQSMLPHAAISTPLVASAFKYVPTDELAGDAIGLHLIDDRFLVAYVLDVSGHGVPAALLSVSAMHALAPNPLEASLLRTRTPGDTGSVQKPSRVALELNHRFRAGENDGRYLTMILTVLDTHIGKLHLTSAGHPPPFILRGQQPLPVPPSGGFPIAVDDSAEYEEFAIQLQPRDRLCLYSDGVIEQPGPGDVLFSDDRLLEILANNHLTPPDQLAAEIVTALTTWADATSFGDDISLVIIDWLGPKTP